MRPTRPTTPADHIARAKESLTGGADPQYAIANALIAIAELLAAEHRDAEATPQHYCEYTNPHMCAWPGHRR